MGLISIWHQVPFFNKMMIVISVMGYMFPVDKLIFLINIPFNTIYKQYLWTIISSNIIHGSIIQLIMNLVLLVPLTIELE